jgi:hypothetical protein
MKKRAVKLGLRSKKKIWNLADKAETMQERMVMRSCRKFLLDLDRDPVCARVALVAYAGACEDDRLELSADIELLLLLDDMKKDSD